MTAKPDEDSPKAPTKQDYAAMVERFGKGWETGKHEQIVQLFTEDGVFISTPFDNPLQGREAIGSYWKNIPAEQAEIAFRFGEIFLAGPWFATEFRCTFRRRRTGDRVDVRGALFCETAGGEISEMRMYWHRRTGGGGE